MPDDFSISLDGRGRRLMVHFNDIPRHWNKGIKKGLKLSGKSIMRETKRILETGSRSGVHYSGQPNQSSAPGEAPASQSGDLVRSGYYKTRGARQLEVGEKEPYAAYLEHDQSGRRIAPRPHLKTAMANKARDVQNYLYRMVERQIRYA
jgi:hypothetical protein